MGCVKTLFKYLTCGLGPYLWHKLKNKIKFHTWALKTQIICSVTTSLLSVLVVLSIVLLVNLHNLQSSASEQFEIEVAKIHDQNLNDFANEASLSFTVLHDYQKNSLNISQLLLKEALFNDNFSVYPLKWQDMTVKEH